MSKKQEELTASEKIKPSRIIGRIEKLSTLLKVYQGLREVKSNNYQIQREICDLENAIGALESQLEDLVDKLNICESSE
ncbi:MAG: cell division protein FtsL [Crocinitomix sp.]|jgi:cell division protein FtsL